MAKAGMRRYGPDNPTDRDKNKEQDKPRNPVAPVPEIQGKAKSGKKRADPENKV